MSPLMELAARVEAATGANRELLADIVWALTPPEHRREFDAGRYVETGWHVDYGETFSPLDEAVARSPDYLSDPSAPLRLIEQRWPGADWRLNKYRRPDGTVVYLAHIDGMLMNAIGFCPAAAATAAALRLEAARQP